MGTIAKPATNRAKTLVNFPFNDKRGRAIGAEIITYEIEYVEKPAGWEGYAWIHPAGSYFYAVVQATRNGESYGAGQRGEMFASAEARAIYMAGRLKASEKAAAKLAAK